MIVGSVKENNSIEKRISITPETAKNFKDLGLQVILEKGYGDHLGISETEYKKNEVEFFDDPGDVIKRSNLLAQLNYLNSDYSKFLDEKIIVGIFNPSLNQSKLESDAKKNIKIFSLELLPRISRAQSMDVLSSQSNLAGYRSVVEFIYEFEKAVPMMMTAAGTVPAAKVLVIGAGVAGLQAIATAKRLGAIVSATDVRQASKEQVESSEGNF